MTEQQLIDLHEHTLALLAMIEQDALETLEKVREAKALFLPDPSLVKRFDGGTIL